MPIGYIKIDRRLLDSACWQDAECGHLWVELLLRARFSDGWEKVRSGSGHRTIKLARGQVIFGRGSYAKRLNQKEGTVRKNLALLAKWGNITTDTTSRPTIVTICNYNTWQDRQEDSRQLGASDAPVMRQLGASDAPGKKKGKKGKKVEETLQQQPLLTAVGVDAIAEEFNQCEGVKPFVQLSPSRRRIMVAKLRDPAWLGLYRQALAKFPLIYRGKDGDWEPDLDWLLKDDNVLKLVETTYFDKVHGSTDNGPADYSGAADI